MTMRWQTFSVPKAGSTPEQNEDAVTANPATFRAAVCDGASEGWASGVWARHLAHQLADAPASPQSFQEWVAMARRMAVGMQSPVVSWYAEEKQAQGAFSTLCGVTFMTGPDGGWKYQAVAVGDSCLFHRRGNELVAKFPLETAAEFGNQPALLGSLPESGLPEPGWFAGRAGPGDAFYMMTDALAEWFLREAEAGGEPWTRLDAVTSAVNAAGEFALWVQSQRQSKALKNDDTSLVRVTIPSG
jgi:hypothetical protein